MRPSHHEGLKEVPRARARIGKTPVLTGFEVRQLLASIDTRTLVGLRDRALIGVMVYTLGDVVGLIGSLIGVSFPRQPTPTT